MRPMAVTADDFLSLRESKPIVSLEIIHPLTVMLDTRGLACAATVVYVLPPPAASHSSYTHGSHQSHYSRLNGGSWCATALIRHAAFCESRPYGIHVHTRHTFEPSASLLEVGARSWRSTLHTSALLALLTAAVSNVQVPSVQDARVCPSRRSTR